MANKCDNARMTRIAARNPTGDRVVMFVPRWWPLSETAIGLPYRAIPIVSTLVQNGIDVDLLIEPHDGGFTDATRRDLDGAMAAVAWLAELNPAEQLPSARAFLLAVAAAAPHLPRFLGGGFVKMTPLDFDFEGLGEAVHGDETGSLLQRLVALRGHDVAERQPFAVDALFQMDLLRFAQPASLLFGNDVPSLQLPTGLGCGKACAFCFYEPTHMRLLPAAHIVDVIAHCHARHGIRQFQLGELDFLAGPKRALDFADGLRRRGLRVSWFALASVQDILRLGAHGMRDLASSGLTVMETGIECGTDDGLRRLGKKFTVADAERAHDLLVATRIAPVHNFILGWPGETPADRRGTIALVDRLHRRAPRCVMHFRHYQAIPTTTFGDRVLHLHGPLPENLAQLEQWRHAQERRLPWLPLAAEDEVRFLAEYVLPLGYGDELAGGRAPLARRLLRRAARLRCRTGFLRWPVDRRVFAATCDRRLRTTWLS